jgi:hypothetical protein
MGLRDAVTQWAEAHLGEVNPAQYWEIVLPEAKPPYPPHWCGAFTLAMLRIAGLTTWSWEVGKGFLYRLEVTDFPKPGDICYRKKKQHHAICLKTSPKRIVAVGGNVDQGKTVDYQVFMRSDTVVYSIQPLVEAIEHGLGLPQ